jgi:hypothetical protein
MLNDAWPINPRSLLITCMRGLGDGVYQRPFIRAQGEVESVYIDTPWPELYADLPGVHPVRPRAMPYRTQAKNIARTGYQWAIAPRNVRRKQFTYALVRGGPICGELERHVDLAGRPFRFDLPNFGPAPLMAPLPIAVIRPVTTRQEWKNLARSPDPKYILEASRILRSMGFYVVAVADIDPPAEWLEGEMPEADAYFVRGELSVTELLALIQNAGVLVGGSGFIVPVGIAARVPLIVIGGGQGGHNAPELVTDPRMDLSLARFVLPDRYCRCQNPQHDCDKAFANFPGRFIEALTAVTPQWLEVAA